MQKNEYLCIKDVKFYYSLLKTCDMKRINDFRDFRTELNIRLETVGMLHRHFCRIEDSCDEGCRLRLADVGEEHVSVMLGDQEAEAYARLVSEIEKLYALVQCGNECFRTGKGSCHTNEK